MTHKLYDRRGVLLGTVTIPPRWSAEIKERRGFRFVLRESATSILHVEPLSYTATMRTVELTETRPYNQEPGLLLYGCSLEEFERLDGCSFSPSAAYLRSVIE